MSHNVSEEYLYRENIEAYFEALAKRISEAQIGKHMEVFSDSLKEAGVVKEDVIKNMVRLYGSEYHLRNDDRIIRFIEAQFMK